MDARSTTSLAAAVAIAAIGLGCGGDGDSTSETQARGTATSTSSLSKAEFVKRANAACEEERAGLEERVSSFERKRSAASAGKPEAYADVVHFVLLPTMEEEIARIEELGAPPGEEERIDALLFAERSALDSVALLPRVASKEAAERHFIEAGRMFRAYGLSSCAHGPEPNGEGT